MKKFILFMCIWASFTSYAQESEFLKGDIELGIGLPNFYRFFPVNRFNYNNVQKSIGSRYYLNETQFIHLKTTLGLERRGSYINSKIGWGKIKNYKNRFSILTSIDLLGSAGSKNFISDIDSIDHNSPYMYTNKRIERSAHIGVSLGFLINLTNRLGLFTEAGIYAGIINKKRIIINSIKGLDSVNRELRFNLLYVMPSQIMVYYKF